MVEGLEQLLKRFYPQGARVEKKNNSVHIYRSNKDEIKKIVYNSNDIYILHDLTYKDYLSMIRKVGPLRQTYIDANPIPLCKNSEYMKIGAYLEDPNKVVIAPFAHIVLPNYLNPKVWIGKGCFIGEGAELRAIEYRKGTITIGNVIIGRDSLVGGFTKLSPGSKVADNTLIDGNLHLEGIIRGKVKDTKREVKPNTKMSIKEYIPERLALFNKADKVSIRLGLYNRKGEIRYNEDRNEVIISKKGEGKITRQDLFKKIVYNPTLSCIFSDIGEESDKALKPHSISMLIRNRLITETVKWAKPSKIKNLALKTMGMKVDIDAEIEPTKFIEYVAPELSTIEKVKVENNVYIVNHLYNNNDFMIGINVIESDLKQGVIIKPGTIIKSGFETEAGKVYRGYYSKE